MAAKRTIEIFSTGCDVCAELVAQVRQAACDSCEVSVHAMQDADVAARAKALSIRALPAVVIDGTLADCCTGRGVDLAVLRNLGLGRA
ncbi:hypothetical protein FHP25_05005 [Vineibacter terrae]|uniref:Thioredoxin-like fold domain-containing protein n=1 Tax=Vineibacter terrae TaxID=2586908 RepID=A0A5C8PTI4_9HYPH|nr:thioredoxin family protein [Vineibacter terrae]TXL80392.1 hypothetical protein FHP25_05005 [Vineibacter terrae]